MEPGNPYSPPGSELSAPPYASALPPDSVSASILESLRATKPWVRLFSILGYIGSALMILAGLFFMAGSSFMMKELQNNPFGAGFGVGIGFFYILMAVFYIFPSIYLSRYASAIDNLLHNRRVVDLEDALKHQKSFWRFAGISFVVLLCLYAVGIVIAIVVAAVGAGLGS